MICPLITKQQTVKGPRGSVSKPFLMHVECLKGQCGFWVSGTDHACALVVVANHSYNTAMQIRNLADTIAKRLPYRD